MVFFLLPHAMKKKKKAGTHDVLLAFELLTAGVKKTKTKTQMESQSGMTFIVP